MPPPPIDGKKIKILVDGQGSETSPDDLGRFKIRVNGKAGDRVRMKIYENTTLSDHGLSLTTSKWLRRCRQSCMGAAGSILETGLYPNKTRQICFRKGGD